MSTAVILPVKSFVNAKQRLGERFGGPERTVLAAAMVEDVLNELAAAELGPLVVVSGEPRALAHAVDAGASTVVDEREDGQSAAALLGLARARELGYERALLVPGDCPADRRPRVERADRASGVARRGDRARSARRGYQRAGDSPLQVNIEPQFGPGSRARHVEQAVAKGLVHEVIRVPSLELDVDTGEDASALADALARHPARAPRTREALGRLAA